MFYSYFPTGFIDSNIGTLSTHSAFHWPPCWMFVDLFYIYLPPDSPPESAFFFHYNQVSESFRYNLHKHCTSVWHCPVKTYMPCIYTCLAAGAVPPAVLGLGNRTFMMNNGEHLIFSSSVTFAQINADYTLMYIICIYSILTLAAFISGTLFFHVKECLCTWKAVCTADKCFQSGKCLYIKKTLYYHQKASYSLLQREVSSPSA